MNDRETKALSYASFLKEWLHFCDVHHGAKCHADPVRGRPKERIPEWVIDTKDNCIVPGHTIESYAALSYVWNPPGSAHGQAMDRLMLTKDNVDTFRQKGELSAAALERSPAVVTDAINLVRFSGVRYIWIDCLCIVQHDRTTKAQVGRMNEIYSGACFTIIAAAKANGLYGSERLNDRYLCGGKAHAAKLQYSLLYSGWAERGWTFQEHLLSIRSLIFLDDACFWDCQETDECQEIEDWQSTVPPRPSAFELTKAPSRVFPPPPTFSVTESYFGFVPNPGPWEGPDVGRRHLVNMSPVPNFDLFVELVCRYSNRDLTYEQDALTAFSGVLDAFARQSFDGGFICGLPALFLDSALLWQPLFKATQRKANKDKTEFAPLAPLPSWSWVGWKCLLDPKSLESAGSGNPSDYCGNSRATRKLVDWKALPADGNESSEDIDEPGMLEDCVERFTRWPDSPLPPGWSRRTREVWGSKAEWFVHESQPETLYRYPLPSCEGCHTKTTKRNPNAARLSCMTSKATLEIRRVLKPTEVETIHSIGAALDVSVFKSPLYAFEPKASDCCPVVVLEDGEGRWAGAFRITDVDSDIKPQAKVELVAVSTGSGSFDEIGSDFAEQVDANGSWEYPWKRWPHHIVHFEPTQESTDRSKGVLQGREGGADEDCGPFRHNRYNSSLYHFYNVLWVETRDKVMYRKAAGRVPKEVWERNCGKPEQIELG